MPEERPEGPAIIEAHQELVSRIEKSARRMKALSAVTILAGGVLAFSYLSQLVLPFFGTNEVVVRLDDPFFVASELVVFGLVLVWLYVGVTDYRFASRMGREIKAARGGEARIEERITGRD